ncbi:MAG: response regulator [Deltaproteobacteria bacterium]|nr:response regulator [Nannocystaceae bacterium]
MSKKVLVVDDSSTVRQQVGSALVQAGFTVLEAVDGLDGAAMIAANSDIALVICDVNMPRMNGLEMVESVRKIPISATMPIIMLTTEGDPSLVARAKLVGAKGWIVKPFKPELLVAAARKLAV